MHCIFYNSLKFVNILVRKHELNGYLLRELRGSDCAQFPLSNPWRQFRFQIILTIKLNCVYVALP